MEQQNPPSSPQNQLDNPTHLILNRDRTKKMSKLGL
jgi:hypothetical protein